MLLDYVLNGLGLGAIFAFIALGYTMVYGIIKLINFAHGEFVMVGAFAGYFALRDLGIDRLPLPQPLPILASLVVAFAAASLASAVLAVVTERVAYRPVRRAGRIAALLTAVGVSLFLQNVAIRVWGAAARPYPDPRVWYRVDEMTGEAAGNLWVERTNLTRAGEAVTVLEQVARPGEDLAGVQTRLRAAGVDAVFRTITVEPKTKQLYVVFALVVLTPILWWLVKRTRLGKAMRAVSEDPDAARLMGIPIDRTVSATFFVGGLLGGIAGVAYCMTDTTVAPLIGYLPGLKAFVAAVIGGIGSIPGAIVGGLLLGLAESVLPYALQRLGWESAFAWKDAIAFALLIVILVVRPTGLLGRPLREKV